MKLSHSGRAVVRGALTAGIAAVLVLHIAPPSVAATAPLRLASASGVLDPDAPITFEPGLCEGRGGSWSVTDGDAKRIASGAIEADTRTLPAGVAPTPGVYRLTVECGGRSGSVRFVRSSGPATTTDPFFSVNVGGSSGSNTKPLAAFAATGAAGYREDLQWQAVEKTAGRFDFGPIDARTDAWIEQGGAAPLFILDYGNTAHTGGAMIPPDVSVPAQRAAWERYVTTSVAHMRERYPAVDRSYEVWNEWNNFHATRSAGPEAYVALAEVTHHAIRRADPDARIVGPGVNAVSASERAWLLDWFGLGGARWVDAISVHPYSMPWAPESCESGAGCLEHTLAWMRSESQAFPSATGGPAPIWITEIGWPTSGVTGVPSGDAGAFLVRAHAVAAVYGVERVYTFELSEPTTGAARAFALVGNADSWYEPRTQAAAYLTMQRQLAGLRFVSVRSEPGVRQVAFASEDGRRRVRVVWQTDERFGSRPTTVPLRGSGSIVDVHGAAMDVTATDGALTMSATWAPRYVVERR